MTYITGDKKLLTIFFLHPIVIIINNNIFFFRFINQLDQLFKKLVLVYNNDQINH